MTDYSTAASTVKTALDAAYQEKLVSAENIKTINNISLLGSGNISIGGGGGGGGGSTTLFEDDCDSATGLSNYSSNIGLRNNGTNTLEYDSTEQAYLLSCTKANSQSCRPINALDGYTDSFTVTITAKSGSSPAPVGLVMYFDDDNWYSIKENFDRVWTGYKVNGTFNEGAEGIHSLQGHTLVTVFTVDNTNHTLNIKSYENNSLINYTNYTINTASATSSVKYCLDNSWGSSDKVYLYDIKVETLGSGGGGSVNIVTSWDSTPSDDVVPSEKLVKDTLDTKISTSSTSGLVKNDGTIDTNTYLTSSSISGMLTSSDIADNLTTNDATKVLSAKQGKALNDLIGQAISYINQ